MTRRSLLRSAAVGSAGLVAASIVGCGDDDAGPDATATPTTDASPSPSLAATDAPADGATPTAARSPLTWQQVSPASSLPSPRRDHSLVTDGDVLYLFGGRNGSDNYADLWMFDPSANAWTELPAPDPPGGRFGHNAVFVPDHAEMLVFGGQAGSSFFADTWAYSTDSGGWQDRTPAIMPAPRYGAASAYDPAVGFIVSHGFTNQGRFNDMWAFDPAQAEWADISAAGDRPLARCLVRAAWDPGTQRLFLFGGQSNPEPFLDDLWVYNGGAWEELAMSLGPAPRNFYSMSYADADRILLFGGNASEGDLNDLWLLDTSTAVWSPIPMEGDLPLSRHGHDSVWLPDESALYVFGGQPGADLANDLWRIAVPTDYQPA